MTTNKPISMPENTWQPWQPRVAFPAFAQSYNSYEFTVQPSFLSRNWKSYLYPLVTFWRKQISFQELLIRYFNAFFSRSIHFRVFHLSKNGQFIKEIPQHEKIKVGESFCYDLDLRGKQATEDMLVLFVASQGRLDKFSSSPGNMTARYSNDTTAAGYRTGFFSRPLNNGKGHYGYTGLNPATSLKPNIQNGILLINHSSNPAYNETARPVIRVYTDAKTFLEKPFPAIAPHGFSEALVEDLFPEVIKWKENKTPFWIVTECKGTSLASFHTYRDNHGNLLAIEHSRPSHAQVLDYWKKKK